MDRTETETLLEGINLTMNEIYTTIKNSIAWRYKTVSQLWGYTTVDDMAQEVLLYYLSVMRSTGEIRLNHYIKKYNDRQHIINMLKQTSYQLPIYTLRSTGMKHKPLSLQVEIKLENDYTTTLEECIEDPKAHTEITKDLLREDFLKVLIEELNTINFNILKTEYLEKKKKEVVQFNASNLPFLLDTKNCLKATSRTKTQIRILKDLVKGCTKAELAKKYDTYKKDMEIIKTAFLGRMKSYLKTQ